MAQLNFRIRIKPNSSFLTNQGRNKMGQHFQMRIVGWNLRISIQISQQFVSRDPVDNLQWFASVVGNGFVPKRRQAISWNNDEPVS